MSRDHAADYCRLWAKLPQELDNWRTKCTCNLQWPSMQFPVGTRAPAAGPSRCSRPAACPTVQPCGQHIPSGSTHATLQRTLTRCSCQGPQPL